MKMSTWLLLMLLAMGCSTSEVATKSGLPYSNPETAARLGYAAGISWGQKTPQDSQIFWLSPDQASACHEELPIPKHYVKPNDFAKGTVEDREEAARVYNLGFYRGFLKGSGVEAPVRVSADCP